MKVEQKDFRFYSCPKMREMKVIRMILDFTDVKKNVENEGKARRFYILTMLKKSLKMNVNPKDFKF